MRKNKWMIAACVTFVLFLLFAGTALWFSNRPSFCQLCHERNEYLTWKKSSHHRIECVKCHQGRGAIGSFAQKIKVAQMLLSHASGNYDKPIKAHVRNHTCKKCHAQRIKKTLVKWEIRISHKELLNSGARCVDCHNTVAHGKRTTNPAYPNMDTCARCHNGEEADAECELCHLSDSPFREAKPPTERIGPWAITHGKAWSKTHGMGNLLTCQICHEADDCVRCHQIELPHGDDFPGIHGRLSMENPDACDRCHNRSLCESCHRIEMPHPETFIKAHSKQIKKLGKSICDSCHIQSDCDECHVRHTHPGNVDPKYFDLKE